MLGAFVASLGMSRSASTSILERCSKRLCQFSNKQYDQAPRAHSSNRKKEWYVEEDENAQKKGSFRWIANGSSSREARLPIDSNWLHSARGV